MNLKYELLKVQYSTRVGYLYAEWPAIHSMEQSQLNYLQLCNKLYIWRCWKSAKKFHNFYD